MSSHELVDLIHHDRELEADRSRLERLASRPGSKLVDRLRVGIALRLIQLGGALGGEAARRHSRSHMAV